MSIPAASISYLFPNVTTVLVKSKSSFYVHKKN